MPAEAVKPLLQEIKEEVFTSHKIRLFLLRLDLLHPYISGNKWFKLKYNLEEAARQGKNTLLTFGGAYSNHIIATAAAAREAGFCSIGIIRGEEKRELNGRLKFAEACGMQLHFVSREAYRKKAEPGFKRMLQTEFGDFYEIPEGGANELGVKGCMEILSLADVPYDIVCCACGTGTTLAGIILSLGQDKTALGFSALKGEFLEEEVRKLTGKSRGKWSIAAEYHFGGYAKTTPVLLKFIEDFHERHAVLLDHVYTGKMMYGIYDKIIKGSFAPGTTVLAIHTGGLFSPS